MLQYEKIDASEGIDANKTSTSKECELCHYCFLKMLGLYLKSMFVMDVMIYQRWFIIRKYSNIKHKGATFSGNEGLRILNSSMLENKGVI